MKEENLFKLYRKRAGYSQKDASDALHVTQSAVSSWEAGRYMPDPQNLKALADLYGVTTDMLLGRSSPIETFGRPIEVKPELIPEDEVMVPLVASLRCGPGFSGDPFTYIKPVPVPKSYITKWGDGLKVIMAVGESMSPTIIPGDMLLCKPGGSWESGNVVSVCYDDSDMIKRIYMTKDCEIDLRSDNPEYETIHITNDDIESDRFHVLGRVLIKLPREL